MPLLFINPTQWFALGFIFIGLSFLMARRIPASVAGAALTVGFVTWGLNASLSPHVLGIGYQIGLFILFLVTALYFSSPPASSPHHTPGSPKPAQETVDVGLIFILSSPIQNGQGLIILNHKKWKLVGKDQVAHSKVVVVSKDKDVLYVRPQKGEAL